MDTDLTISELLKEYFPTECETAGPTNLEDIVESNVDFISAEHGSNMDLGSAIQTLVVAATFIKSVLDIYTIIKKETGHDPDETELVIRIASKKDLISKLNKQSQDQITKAIVKKLKR